MVSFVVQAATQTLAVEGMSAFLALSGHLAPTLIAGVDRVMTTSALGDWTTPSFVVDALWLYEKRELLFKSPRDQRRVLDAASVLALPEVGEPKLTTIGELMRAAPVQIGGWVVALTANYLVPWNGPPWACTVRLVCRPHPA